jgi:hypothetical protein
VALNPAKHVQTVPAQVPLPLHVGVPGHCAYTEFIAEQKITITTANEIQSVLLIVA